MNERINELWNLARNPSGRGHDEQKFAELIVQECIHTIIVNTPAPNPEFDTVWELGYNGAMKDCVHYIAEHFDGVEE
jgi:hypothetical protein